MADLGVRMGFGQFAAEAARCNLPVGMLNEVSRSSYSFQSGRENETSTWLNILYLSSDTLAKVASLSSSPKPALTLACNQSITKPLTPGSTSCQRVPTSPE